MSAVVKVIMSSREGSVRVMGLEQIGERVPHVQWGGCCSGPVRGLLGQGSSVAKCLGF